MAYIARLSADMPTDVSFIAPTLGVESTCIPITVYMHPYHSALFEPDAEKSVWQLHDI